MGQIVLIALIINEEGRVLKSFHSDFVVLHEDEIKDYLRRAARKYLDEEYEKDSANPKHALRLEFAESIRV